MNSTRLRQMHRFRTLLCLLLSPLALSAQEMEMQMSETTFSREQLDFFESKIRPQLIEHCYQCHAKDGDKIKGGLLLDTRNGLIRGGDSGTAIVPGSPEDSLLYIAMTYEDSSLEMPKKKKLPDSIIADFYTWIEMGAPDPRHDPDGNTEPESYTSTIDIEKGREHWAYQPPLKHAIPAVSDETWARNGIDQFILAQLDEKTLEPNVDAEARTLLRRLYYDLIGLPPTPSASDAFASAYATDPDAAVEKAVDLLLASEHFGERWGRHWLDVARYAESCGKEENHTYPTAWRYRDYVIDALNADKPYDEFIQEQIAGDLLPAESDAERAEHLIATGFLAIGPKSLGERNPRQFQFDLVDEQIDVATKTVLGTTVACARCHDHKFDPIPMSDYYSLAGVFLSSETKFGTLVSTRNQRGTDLVKLPIKDSTTEADLGTALDLEMQLTAAQERADGIREQIREERRDGGDSARLRNSFLATTTQIGTIEKQLAMYDDEGNPVSLAMGVIDRAEPFDAQLLIRGEEDNVSDRVPRGYVQVIKTDDEQPMPADSSGRLEVAEWMTSPENPLTARVMANRTWHWLFGKGLVPSVDNFGTTGDKPSNPELLDHLAIRLIELNWSVKSLIKEITTSRTYRQASTFDEAKFLADPENDLVWRYSPKRLDAEAIRDSILASSDQLVLERPEGSKVGDAGPGRIGRAVTEAEISVEPPHRSVYLPIVRDLVPPSLDLFDFTDPSLSAGAREVTTIPSQALYMMNSPFVIEQSQEMARNLLADPTMRGTKLGIEAFRIAYSRPPTAEEGRKTAAYFERFRNVAKDGGMSQEEANLLALTSFCQSLISSAEFRYVN